MIELAPRGSSSIGVEIVPFNWALRRARERLGWSRADLARKSKVPGGDVGLAEKLHEISPVYRERIALALQVPEDDLFPGAVDAAGEQDSEVIVSHAQAHAVQDGERAERAVRAVDQRQLAERVGAALDTLPPRLQRVVKMRYGLIYGAPKTLDEVAFQFGVTKERIRQLEARALRLLRHPARSKLLREPADAPRPAATQGASRPALPPREGPHTAPSPPRTQVRLPQPPMIARRAPEPPPFLVPAVPLVVPFLAWVWGLAAVVRQRRSSDGEIAYAILETPCCYVFDDPERLRPHIAEEHVTTPRMSFWQSYDAFCNHYADWRVGD